MNVERLYHIGRDADAADPETHLVILEVRDWEPQPYAAVVSPPVLPGPDPQSNPNPNI